MVVRKATLQDKNELIRLIKAFHKDAQLHLSSSQANIREYKDLQSMAEEKAHQYLTQPKYIVFVAADSGVLRGYCSGEIQERKYRLYDKSGYIENWFVEEAFQNHGFGKEMFDRLVEEFKKADCTHLDLDTNIENAKAIGIYEHMGFQKRLVTFFKPLKHFSS